MTANGLDAATRFTHDGRVAYNLTLLDIFEITTVRLNEWKKRGKP